MKKYLLCLFMFLLMLGIQTQVHSTISTAEKAVFVHMMISFATPEISGRWDGWNHSNQKIKHYPDVLKSNGQRDIASVYYPIIGPYDMTDPHLVEYHCQLMKMSDIDGAVFDLGFFIEPNTLDKKKADFTYRSIQLYLQYFKAYHLKGAVLFEDKANWIWNDKLKTREDTVEAAISDLENWMGVFMPIQYKIDDKPLLFIYSYNQTVGARGKSRLSPVELKAWKKTYPRRIRPIVLANEYHADYYGVHDGVFQWPEIIGPPPKNTDYTFFNDLEKEKRLWKINDLSIKEQMEKREYKWVCGTIWPGFNDAGCMSWGSGHKVIPRYSGDLYKYHWERVIHTQYPLVLIATWNDWFEGINIEPAKEFGYHYLELTRQWAGQWKGSQPTTANLKLAEWIYMIRKKSSHSRKALNAADQASRAIMQGNYEKAENLLKPFVQVLKIAEQ